MQIVGLVRKETASLYIYFTLQRGMNIFAYVVKETIPTSEGYESIFAVNNVQFLKQRPLNCVVTVVVVLPV